MHRNWDYRIWLLAAAVAALTTPSNAYIDPGSGSFALQFLLAGAFGLIYALKTRFASVRHALSKKHVRNPEGHGPARRT